MAVYNNQAIQNGPYQLVSEAHDLNGRDVYKYIFNLNGDRARVAVATNIVLRVLAENPQFCPTFETGNREALEQVVEQNLYLTINGRAVSLAPEREAPAKAGRDHWDRFFSETIIEEPVRCPQGHFFERRRATVWARRMDNVCPVTVEGNHLIGDLHIDREVQYDINRYRNQRNEKHQGEQAREQLRIDNNGILRLHSETKDLERKTIERVKKVNSLLTLGAVGKTALKLGGPKAVVQIGTKLASKTASSTVAKRMAKVIPGVSLVVGVGLMFARIKQGQYVRAFGELVSGAVACIPGGGLYVSVGLDVIIAIADTHETITIQGVDAIAQAEPDLNAAYRIIGINLQDDPNPPRDLVERYYRDTMRPLHPDKNVELGGHNQQQLAQMAVAVTNCMGLIRQQRGWA